VKARADPRRQLAWQVGTRIPAVTGLSNIAAYSRKPVSKVNPASPVPYGRVAQASERNSSYARPDLRFSQFSIGTIPDGRRAGTRPPFHLSLPQADPLSVASNSPHLHGDGRICLL